jgi:hypothetical protein
MLPTVICSCPACGGLTQYICDETSKVPDIVSLEGKRYVAWDDVKHFFVDADGRPAYYRSIEKELRSDPKKPDTYTTAFE